MSFWGKNKKANSTDLKKFAPNKKIGNYIWIDTKNQLLMVSTKNMMKPKYLLRFDNLVGYSVFQDDKEITKRNGLTRAAVGGLLFGSTGAIVGAVTGSESKTNYVKNLWINLELDGINTEGKKVMIPFIVMSKTDVNSALYKGYKKDLEACLSELDNILEPIDYYEQNNFNQIRELKQLLDENILTQEEFEIKKKELLNL